MGIQFVDIDEEAKKMIVDLVDALNRSRQRRDSSVSPSSS
jgi:hypothetical protein